MRKSTTEALKVIHDMLLRRDFSAQSKVQEEFRTFDAAVIETINLGGHFMESIKVKAPVNHAFEIIKWLNKARRYM